MTRLATLRAGFRPATARSLALLLTVLVIAAGRPSARAVVPEGFLDVTTLGADPTGVADSTSALQAALNQGRDQNLVVWLPAGTYRVTNRLVIDQPDNDASHPVILMGSTVNPAQRAVIELAANSPGFGNPAARRAVVHFINSGTPDAEGGNTDLYNQVIAGVDIRVLAGNDGAVGLRMQGAEGCTIQDVRIDLTQGGHTGIWGIPASGGATHQVTVTGGAIGIDTRRADNLGGGGSQPQPVVTGSSFLNQTDKAIYATVRGSLVLVGCRIERNVAGPAIWLNYHWVGQPFDASLQLVDTVIDHAVYSPLNTVIQMSGSQSGRSFLLDNCHVRNALHVHTASAPANPAGWMHFRRLAVHVQPRSRSWGQPTEPVWVDGAVHGDVLVQSTPDVAPPADLQARHRWGDDFPSWETPGAVNAKTLGVTGDGVTDDWAALQAAIDAHEIVFLPRGTYLVSQTLDLRPDSKLIGASQVFTVVTARSTLSQRFAGTTEALGDRPIVRTADVAEADTILAFLHLRRAYPLAQHNPTPPGNYALEWRCGGSSLVRHVQVQAKPGNNIRPDFVALYFYGYDLAANPIDFNHPQISFLPGHWAWCSAEPTVQVRGHGGGRWYTFWMHGRQALRSHVPFLRIEGTTEPLQIYHLHSQQQDSVNHAEVIDAANVTIYGTKGEIKGTQVYFEGCDNVRLFGHSGLSSPDPDRNPPYLFRFIDCTNLQISGIGDTIREGSSVWTGGIYDRWIHANLLTWQPILDQHADRPTVVVPSAHRPILYVRGQPGPGRGGEAPPPGAPVVTITAPANFHEAEPGEAVTFTGTAVDPLDGDLTATATWTSSVDGLLGTGGTLTVTTLSPGTHAITLAATNAAGLTGSAAISVTVASSTLTTFTNAAGSGTFSAEANWSNGLPDEDGLTGIVDLAGTFKATTGGTGGTFRGYVLDHRQGAVQESGSLSLRGGQWTLSGSAALATTGGLNVAFSGDGDAQSLTVAGGAVQAGGRMQIYAGGVVTLEDGQLGGQEWLTVSGLLDLRGGAAAFTTTGARLQTNGGGRIRISGGSHTFHTLRLQDGGPLELGGSGVLQVTSWDTGPSGVWAVDFTGPTAASLTVAGRDAAWFAARYAAGRLTYQGGTSRPFAEVFRVEGSTVSPLLSPYAEWARGHGLEGVAADPALDIDGDHLETLLEYGLGGSPVDVTDAPVPVVDVDGASVLHLTFERTADPDLVYEVWATGDLGDWGPEPLWTSTGAANLAGPVTVPDVVPTGPGLPRFLRLVVRLASGWTP